MVSLKKPSSSQVCNRYGHSFLIFIMFIWICSTKAMGATGSKTITVNIGVVLDMETMYGRRSLSSLSLSFDDFYSSHSGYQTRIAVHVRDSKEDVVSAASAGLDLIKNGQVKAIIGPDSSMQAHFLLNLGNKAKVPIISFSATSPSLSPVRNPYFFRATQNDSVQVKALSSLIKHFSWREAVPIYVQNEYGEGIIPYLTDALQEVDCRVPYRSIIAPEATDLEIREELYKLMTMESRVFIVHMLPDLGSRVFKNAKQIGMMDGGFVWIMTNGIGDMLNILNSTVLKSMHGALGIKNHIPKSKELGDFRIRWKRKFQSENSDVLSAELDIFDIWAHDAAVALAMAVEKVFSNKPEAFIFKMHNGTGNLTDLESFGESNAGPKLREALLSSSFKGYAGNFYFVNGEIPPYAYQIVNVDENGGREVGYWTSPGGISRLLKFNETDTKLKPVLGPIIWPGESKLVPKGWKIPVNGKKLQVGVPVKDGFLDFIRITRDPVTNATSKVTGYCIDVFEAVIQAMPYAVQYEYIPFALPDGTSSGSYNDLIYQVYLGKFDAVVGDVTIVANRSLYADFTLPYTESGVSIIVPVKDHDHDTKNAWVFLKPLTWRLWFTSFCFFVFIGFVVWVLEHRTNEDFRGPPLYQVGVMLWFSFSTMVFAHRENVVSNLARFVVIVWVFVVLILIQTYTASLTAMLTVQKLQPTISDVNELVKNGDVVGYQRGSFVLDLLKQLNFDESKLIQYDSLESLEDAFRKGSANGGVSAVFDELPYTRLFLGKHCSKYAVVGPTYKTNGFGFVFPKLSPLAPDVSRAILNVTQGEQMVAIERKWFGHHETCPDGSSTPASNIGLDSFWGLFLIAGVASVSALLIYLAIFLYSHREDISSNSTLPWWKQLVKMLKLFDDLDENSHTVRKNSYYRKFDGTHMGSARASSHPKSSRSRSPDHALFSLYGDRRATSSDNGDPSSSQKGQRSPDVWINIVDVAADPERKKEHISRIVKDISKEMLVTYYIRS